MKKSIIAIALASLAVAACAAPVQVASQRDAFIASVNRSCHGALDGAAVYDSLPEASKQDPALLAKFDNICSKFVGLESN